MPKEWTQERRDAQAKAMRERHAVRRNQQADPNPAANDDIVREPSSSVRPPRSPHVAASAAFEVSFLVAELESMPIDSISYADCGTLLNALSAASTAVALRRRQAQEQLTAGTHKAPCNTCGTKIDISKPGGFQILTERDEHFQPVNRYYCSQNCLLAKNMPSHRVKRIAGDVGAKV